MFDIEDEGKEVTTLHEPCGAVSYISLAKDKPYLTGISYKGDTPYLTVWNISLNKLIHKTKFELDKNEGTQICEPTKLMITNTHDSNLLFMRGCYFKGVKIISLDDGVLMDEIQKMHF